jgi:hypothetical protein
MGNGHLDPQIGLCLAKAQEPLELEQLSALGSFNGGPLSFISESLVTL